ncbi:MAG: hypothetical protein ABUL72_02320 [Armatimonadota bacterium]
MRTNRRTKNRGQTLVEAVFACFVTLTCALVFSATVPVANVSRGKGERMAAATSLAYKQAENLKAIGYASLDGASLATAGYISANTLVNMQTAGLTTTSELGYESTTIDSTGVDSASTILPSGRSFVELTQVDIDLRQITVVVFWKENNQWRNVRVGTLVANM